MLKRIFALLLSAVLLLGLLAGCSKNQPDGTNEQSPLFSRLPPIRRQMQPRRAQNTLMYPHTLICPPTQAAWTPAVWRAIR